MPIGDRHRTATDPLTGGALGGGIENASPGSTLTLASTARSPATWPAAAPRNAGVGGSALGGGIENNRQRC